MFSSIKWKFIVVYFVLIFIAMVIVGIYILNSLEEQQLSSLINSMEQRLETIVNSSSYLTSDDWINHREDIQNTINQWGFSNDESVFVIYDDRYPLIIASTLVENHIGQNALSNKFIEPTLVIDALAGKINSSIVVDANEDTVNQHLAYPVYSNLGQVEGILYMTSDLEYIFNTVRDARTILNSATLLALVITIFLGFLIASSITEPIRDVTKKAEKMAKGDFDQFVDVKSGDEIGQLASMFNYLTLKLKHTINEMDLERSKLDTIFNYMVEGVVAIDKKFNIIHANPIAMDILNLNEDYIKATLDLGSLDLNNIDYKKEKTLEGEVVYTYNNEVYKIKYAPFKNEDKSIVGLIMVFQDFTKEHKLDNMRKEFVANVSHELKTPITTIKSYSETIIDRDLDKDKQDEFLNLINVESDRMARLVHDLLRLSNIDYQQTSWKEEEIRINTLIDRVLYNLDLSIKEKRINIYNNMPDDLPAIIADTDGIELVIINVITNAIKYNKENGNIYIDGHVNDDSLILEIKDEGVGIPEDDIGRIFERFYRVEKGRSRDMGGTGLGLSIAKEVVRANNGTIALSSKQGEGTVVTLTFLCK